MSTQISGDFEITHVHLESKVMLITGAMSFALTVAWEASTIWRTASAWSATRPGTCAPALAASSLPTTAQPRCERQSN